jgi:hypothetical protein
MNKINLSLVITLILVAVSAVAYNINNAVQISKDISLEEIKDCQMEYWNETIPIMGNCTESYDVKTCNEPLNTSCSLSTKSYTYTCVTGYNTEQKSKENCKDKSMKIGVSKMLSKEMYLLDYSDWGKCSYSPLNDSVLVICDSRYDGNADGICQQGESCIVFIVDKYTTKRLFKNSRIDFVEEDPTFYQEKLDMEVE